MRGVPRFSAPVRRLPVQHSHRAEGIQLHVNRKGPRPAAALFDRTPLPNVRNEIGVTDADRRHDIEQKLHC